MSEIKMKHLAVGISGGLWAAGATDGTIYQLYGDAGLLGWVPDKDGKADVIAVADGGEIWCVNKEHQIWHGVPTENASEGLHWNQVATHSRQADARTISVGTEDGTVWYADNTGALFHRESSVWVPDEIGKATVIAAVSKDEIWCANQDHQIWHLQGGEWEQFPTHSGRTDARTVAAGSTGNLWYISTDGTLYAYRLDGGVWSRNDNWKPDQMGIANLIAARTWEMVWGLNTQGEVWRAIEGRWQKVSEVGPNEGNWTYQVTSYDRLGLGQIVMTQYPVQDAPTINRIIDRIVALNHLASRDQINKGQTLSMPPLNYR
jgi:hypothetical protein